MATFNQADIDAFKAAMLANPGVTRMKIADTEYFFDSLEAMRKHLQWMESNLASAATPSTYTRYAATGKGFGWIRTNGRSGWGQDR